MAYQYSLVCMLHSEHQIKDGTGYMTQKIRFNVDDKIVEIAFRNTAQL